jgi:hydroxymethylglutaryl-CoA lyase
MKHPSHVRVVEVAPRDGLQNEDALVGTDDKIRFVDGLSGAGFALVEVTAFVNPRRVPQMADAESVLRGITRRPGTRYSALVPNVRGLERALESSADEVAIFAAASETFSQRNINQSIDGSLATYRDVCAGARRANVKVRGYLSTSFGCPFEGAVAPSRVADHAARLFDLGVYELALSDTIGVANPALVERVVEAASRHVPLACLALHFHDTRGTALANILAGLWMGVATFDASAGGLGGCPFAPGATGNVATEDVVYMLDGMGVPTGVSLPKVVEATAQIEAVLGRPLPSRYYRAVQGRWGG